jgi:uncharacterized protein YjbI with pentapeptide repeats
VVIPNALVHPDAELSRSDLLKARNDVRTAGIQIVGGAALLGGLLFTYQANKVDRDTLRVSEQSQITERFTRAIDQLGSDKADVRLGGVYALERIAGDSKTDAGPIVKILAAYLREHQGRAAAPAPRAPSASAILPLARQWKGSCAAPLPDWATSSLSNSPADVQAALTVLQKLLARTQTRSLDLSSVNLAGAHLESIPLLGANLSGANLAFVCASQARLDGANLDSGALTFVDLTSAHLQGATFRGADLSFSLLTGAVLSDGKLRGADLSYANLGGTQLQRASLAGANLSNTFLLGANLQGAELADADLTGANVTQQQIDSASTNEHTRLSPGLQPRGGVAAPPAANPSPTH